MQTRASEPFSVDGVHIAALDEHHGVAHFDSGAGPLDTYLKRFALANQTAGAPQTFVATVSDRVIGYYRLSAASADGTEAPDTRHDDAMPVMLLACLAVDRRWQGKGVGAALLHDALRRTRAAADRLGLRAVMVYAKDRASRRFYERFGFDPSPIGPFHLLLPLGHDSRPAG